MPRDRNQPRNPKAMVMTPRDRIILRYVAVFGVLSTEQLTRLCFASVTRARKRLRLLWSHRFLHRTTRPVRMGAGTSPHLYTLAARGRGYVRQESSGVPVDRHTASFGLHAQRIADFRIGLLLAVDTRKEMTLERWEGGRALRNVVVVKVAQRMRQVPVVPDGFCVLRQQDRTFAFMVEIDRATTDLGRIRTKFLAYIALWESRQIQQQTGVRSFRVLYVTTGEKRASNMLAVLRQLATNTDRPDIIYIASAVVVNDPKTLFSDVWQTVDRTGAIRAVRLVSGSPPLTLPTAPVNPTVRGPDAGAG